MDVHGIRAEFAQELGCKLDDMLEAAKFEVIRDEGAAAALQAAVKRLSEVSISIDKDLDAGAFSNISEPLAVASVIKKYLVHVCAILDSGVKSADGHKLLNQGRVQAFELMVSNMKKLHNLEQVKVVQRQEAPEGLIVQVQNSGLAPGLPLKERRRLEGMAELVAPPQEPLKAKRGRPAKGI